MRWILRDLVTDMIIREGFESREDAVRMRDKSAPLIRARLDVEAICEENDNPELVRMLNEGLVRGDLRNILLPRLSIDEYVSADPNADNVVVAFFVKGVPEAVLPLKNFCEHCEGVRLADYANSETIENCSIVYAEMDRPTVEIDNIVDMLEQICIIAEMKPEDFTLTFPNTQKKYPYDPAVIEKYFRYRTEEQSKEALKAAMQDDEPSEKIQEAMVNRMVGLFGALTREDLKSISVL